MRLGRGAFVVLVGALAFAAPAGASTTVGANLLQGNAGTVLPPDTFMTYTGGHASAGAMTTGATGVVIRKDDNTSAAIPVDGVVVSFSIRMSQPVTGRLRLLDDPTGHASDPTDLDEMRYLGTGPTVSVPGDSQVHTYPVRLPAGAGFYIGFGSPSGWVTRTHSGASQGAERFLTDLNQDNTTTSEAQDGGSTFRAAHQAPVSAVVEPDADIDGFGDETQDACPGVKGSDGGCQPGSGGGNPGGSTGGGTGGGTAGGGTTGAGSQGDGSTGTGAAQTPAAATDTIAPRFSSLVLSPTSFVAANSGPSVVAAKKVGTTVVFKLSESASVKFTVQRKASGVKKGKRCVAGRPGNGKKRCTRAVTVPGSFTQDGVSGLNQFKFMGRLNRKAIKPGSYQLVATATDATGNTSKSVNRPFRIVSG
jgi:hypothetical protein